jgi:hypothetical protein
LKIFEQKLLFIIYFWFQNLWQKKRAKNKSDVSNSIERQNTWQEMCVLMLQFRLVIQLSLGAAWLACVSLFNSCDQYVR